jgi:BirA family biotin operon repressor/biotin-[acetyl-CoA-carboxylase] ligase
MVDAAMAVVTTLLAFNVTPQIKWPNDIWVDGKKICGILIQNAFRGDMVDYSLVGIGINVNNDIADEIKDIAISLKQKLNKEIDLESFFLTFTLNYSSGCSIEEYKKFSAVIGKRVTVTRGEEEFEAVVEDVLNNGALKLSNGELLYAGELNLKVQI